MTASPAVTVILPTHNRRRLLSRAVASVLAQVDVVLELIVVDDHSNDDTLECVSRMRDERVRAHRLTPGSGVAKARNLAIREARGDWIAFLDDDDFWAPDKLRRQLGAASASGAGLVYTQAVVLDSEGNVTRITQAPGAVGLDVTLLQTNAIGTPSGVIARAAAVRESGGFDERLSIFADWDLWLRLVPEVGACLVDEPVFAYVEHSANMHVERARDARAELRYLAAKHRSLCRAHGVRFGSETLSRWLISRYRPGGYRRQAAREYLSLGVRERSPRDLGRAVGMLLGERATKMGRHVVGPAMEDEVAEPAAFALPWLAEAWWADAFAAAS